MLISDLDYTNRLIDAYRRFFASRNLDDETPVSVLFDAFVISVNQLPDLCLGWLRNELRAYCCNARIAPGSNLPRQVSYDNFLFMGR